MSEDHKALTVAPIDCGLHYGIPAIQYHADPCHSPSLSSGVARTILNRSIAHAYLEHPRLGGSKKEQTAAMGLGSLVHALLAGDQAEIVIGNFDSFRSGAARDWRDKTEAAGKIPVLENDLTEARLIADIIKNKAALGCDNSPFVESGKSEVTAIWKEGDAFCRARFDRLVIDPNGYADVWDWKTTTDVSERAIVQAIAKYGYHTQAAFYLRGLTECLPSHLGRVSFTFVFVETTAPYAIRRVCLSPEFMAVGKREASKAIHQWKTALASNNWEDPRSSETLHVAHPSWMDEDDAISAS